MPTATVEQDVLELEKEYWQAVKDNDIDVAMRLCDDPCIITGAQGVALVTRDLLSRMMKAATYKLHYFAIDGNVTTRRLGDDVVVVAYKVSEELTVDGKPVKLEAADASTWVRRNGRWLCALHTESVLGDPFGRDRGGT